MSRRHGIGSVKMCDGDERKMQVRARNPQILSYPRAVCGCGYLKIVRRLCSYLSKRVLSLAMLLGLRASSLEPGAWSIDVVTAGGGGGGGGRGRVVKMASAVLLDYWEHPWRFCATRRLEARLNWARLELYRCQRHGPTDDRLVEVVEALSITDPGNLQSIPGADERRWGAERERDIGGRKSKLPSIASLAVSAS
ncbi:hypothetical protein DL98DRAFT_528045 [Cadophora sp. DSE1049]|nr:hypothetical protein DL98DRAFT_528045 [Cadophora sp. DSE1049]